jgi:hypothetical protein
MMIIPEIENKMNRIYTFISLLAKYRIDKYGVFI